MTHHLLGMAELAAHLGVSRQRVHQLMAEHPDFPPPAADLATGRVWHTADITAWAQAHPPRKPGRPRKTPPEQHPAQ